MNFCWAWKSLLTFILFVSRYNPENIKTLEHYVELQAREKGYDLEANLALLKLYQFNPTFYRLFLPFCKLLYDFLSLKNDVNVPLKSNKQINSRKNWLFFGGIFHWRKVTIWSRIQIRIRNYKRRKFVPYRCATRKQSQAHTANVRLVRVGVIDQTVVTTTPSTSGILCLVPLLLVHKLSTWKRTIA